MGVLAEVEISGLIEILLCLKMSPIQKFLPKHPYKELGLASQITPGIKITLLILGLGVAQEQAVLLNTFQTS